MSFFVRECYFTLSDICKFCKNFKVFNKCFYKGFSLYFDTSAMIPLILERYFLYLLHVSLMNILIKLHEMFTILWRCTENIILLGVIVFEIFTPKYCLFAKG